jgi:hypothetical protein
VEVGGQRAERGSTNQASECADHASASEIHSRGHEAHTPTSIGRMAMLRIVREVTRPWSFLVRHV